MIETKEKREIRKEESERFQFTYRKYSQAVRRLLPEIKKENFDAIIAIHAGGLPLAVHLKNLLDLPMFIVYPTQYKHGAYLPDMNKCLLVDDINDSGGTFETMLNHINQNFRIMNIKTLALLEKPVSSFKCDYVGFSYEEDAWVEFHWEILG